MVDQSHVQKNIYVIRDANEAVKQPSRILGEYGRPKLNVKKPTKAGSIPNSVLAWFWPTKVGHIK
jgi:hypothetical protein